MTKAELEKVVSTLSDNFKSQEARIEKMEKEIEALKAPKVSDHPQPPTRSLVFR